MKELPDTSPEVGEPLRTAVRQLKQGNVAGLELLVQTFQVKAVRAAYLIVRDRAAAQDIVQNAFLRAYERIGQFDEARPFGPWFYRILVNDAVKAASRRRNSVSFDGDPADDHALIELLASAESDPVVAAERAEQRAAVWTALARLSPAQRGAIVAHYFLDFTEAEIARQYASPLGTIKWRLHTAKNRLRELLTPARAETVTPTTPTHWTWHEEAKQ